MPSPGISRGVYTARVMGATFFLNTCRARRINRFESSSLGPDPQEQGYGGQLHQHRERDDRTERDVVEITHKGAAEKPEYAVSRVEDPISRAALVGCHHIGNGRSYDGFLSPHADPPQRGSC